MTRDELTGRLCSLLLEEMPQYRHWAEAPRLTKRRLLRALMNVRPPRSLDPVFLRMQDELLGAEREEKGVVKPETLPQIRNNLILWQGDITRIGADAIVNAANSALLGCFAPCHGCIDNAIHSAAGLQLRDECSRIMEAQGHDEPSGKAKLTHGYNLPARYVIHTVGPIVGDEPAEEDRVTLASCYRSCLELAEKNRLKSLAFCCISTGEFRFLNELAAEIACKTVTEYQERGGTMIVIFDVFKDKDHEIYQKLLGR